MEQCNEWQAEGDSKLHSKKDDYKTKECLRQLNVWSQCLKYDAVIQASALSHSGKKWDDQIKAPKRYKSPMYFYCKVCNLSCHMGNLNKAKHAVSLMLSSIPWLNAIKKYDLLLCREFLKLPELSEPVHSYLNTLKTWSWESSCHMRSGNSLRWGLALKNYCLGAHRI